MAHDAPAIILVGNDHPFRALNIGPDDSIGLFENPIGPAGWDTDINFDDSGWEAMTNGAGSIGGDHTFNPSLSPLPVSGAGAPDGRVMPATDSTQGFDLGEHYEVTWNQEIQPNTIYLVRWKVNFTEEQIAQGFYIHLVGSFKHALWVNGQHVIQRHNNVEDGFVYSTEYIHQLCEPGENLFASYILDYTSGYSAGEAAQQGKIWDSIFWFGVDGGRVLHDTPYSGCCHKPIAERLLFKSWVNYLGSHRSQKNLYTEVTIDDDTPEGFTSWVYVWDSKDFTFKRRFEVPALKIEDPNDPDTLELYNAGCAAEYPFIFLNYRRHRKTSGGISYQDREIRRVNVETGEASEILWTTNNGIGWVFNLNYCPIDGRIYGEFSSTIGALNPDTLVFEPIFGDNVPALGYSYYYKRPLWTRSGHVWVMYAVDKVGGQWPSHTGVARYNVTDGSMDHFPAPNDLTPIEKGGNIRGGSPWYWEISCNGDNIYAYKQFRGAGYNSDGDGDDIAAVVYRITPAGKWILAGYFEDFIYDYNAWMPHDAEVNQGSACVGFAGYPITFVNSQDVDGTFYFNAEFGTWGSMWMFERCGAPHLRLRQRDDILRIPTTKNRPSSQQVSIRRGPRGSYH